MDRRNLCSSLVIVNAIYPIMYWLCTLHLPRTIELFAISAANIDERVVESIKFPFGMDM